MFLLTNKTIEKLQHDLVREGLVDIDGLTLAQENAKSNGTNIAFELVKANLISEKGLLKFIEDKLHIPCVDLDDYAPDANCLSYISLENAQEYNIFPLFKIEDVLTIAMSDPLDLFTINSLFEFSEISIEPVVCSEMSIKKAIDKYYLNAVDDEDVSWQEIIVADNISDESLKNAIESILVDAIKKQTEYILMERAESGLSIFFNKELLGFIPNILVPRFLAEFNSFANLNAEVDDIAQNSKFLFKEHSVFVSSFPARFSTRIMLKINKPLKSIEEYGIDRSKLEEIIKEPALIGIFYENFQNIAYSLAEYLSSKREVLLVENQSQYELRGVTQMEFAQNTGVYFDRIINQIDFQNFDIIFWEKVYTPEQLKKLKLLAKEKVVIVGVNDEILEYCDFILNIN